MPKDVPKDATEAAANPSRDSRPRPRYGEYAPITPTPLIPTPPETQSTSVEQPAVRPQASVSQASSTATPGQRPRTWDLILTSVLLGFGIVDVVSGFSSFSDLPATLRTLYLDQGIGEYTNTQLALGVGAVVNASRIVLLIIAIGLSSSRLRAGKLAWPVPLIAGGVSLLIVVASLLVAMVGDPALAAYVAQLPTN